MFHEGRDDGAVVRILVVEDYAPLRESIARGLRREGHVVETCEDGCTGLELALGGTDLVVLDLMLPGYDGLEFLRRFTLHILPVRFVKIRRYGIYNHTVKRHLELQFVTEEKPDVDALINRQNPPETRLQRFERLTGVNPCQCPVCKTGRMVVIWELPRIRAPDGSFPTQYPEAFI